MVNKADEAQVRASMCLFKIFRFIVFFAIVYMIIQPRIESQYTMSHEEAVVAIHAGTCTYFTYQIDTVMPEDEPEELWSMDFSPPTYWCNRAMSGRDWLYVYTLLYLSFKLASYIFFKLFSALIRAIDRRLRKLEE